MFGAWLGARVSARTIAIGSATIAVLVYVFGFTSIMRGPVHALIRRDSIPAERLDAVIVLWSFVSADSHLDAAAVERLLTGLALFLDNGARLLVTTRSPVSDSDPRLESDTDRRRLIDLAADTGRWHAVGPVSSTRDEAVRTAALDERLYTVYTFNSSTTRLHATADWLYEELAMLKYRWHGWI